MENPLIIRRHLTAADRSRVDEKVRTGRLTAVLPGAYTADSEGSWLHRVWAAQGLRPGAVLTRQTAARLDFWPELLTEAVHIDGARFSGAPDWLQASNRHIPDRLVMRRGGLRMSATPLTVLDLVDDLGGSAIDEALRRRVVTLTTLQTAMDAMVWRRGNGERRRLLHDSRDQPWSELERDAHTTLRRHHVIGWKANYRVSIMGHVFYVDIAFPGLRLAVEMDGWAFHRTREDMDRDAARHNWLQFAGWRVLRFTAATLEELPEWVRRFQRREESGRWPQHAA